MTDAEKRLERAKKACEPLSDGGRRQWLVASVKSYGDDINETIVHVMEGSPPRAFIVEQPSRCFVTVLDSCGKLYGRVEGGYGIPIRWHPARRKLL